MKLLYGMLLVLTFLVGILCGSEYNEWQDEKANKTYEMDIQFNGLFKDAVKYSIMCSIETTKTPDEINVATLEPKIKVKTTGHKFLYEDADEFYKIMNVYLNEWLQENNITVYRIQSHTEKITKHVSI